MDERKWLTEKFEVERPRLRAVAYRMLGSISEAEDAVQEAWLRLHRTEDDVENLSAWLTTVVARIALNMLRSRKTRSETQLPDPIIDRVEQTPEREAMFANTVGLALLVVLESVAPAERVAFVLHDVFGMSFEEIGPIVERTSEAARQLASRARRRVQDRKAIPDADVAVQRSVVDAFFAAQRDGDFRGLVAVLDPKVVLRADEGVGKLTERHGAENVARGAQSFWNIFSQRDLVTRRVLVNSTPGVVAIVDGEIFSVMCFTVRNGKIAEIDVLRDPKRLGRLDLTFLGARGGT